MRIEYVPAGVLSIGLTKHSGRDLLSFLESTCLLVNVYTETCRLEDMRHIMNDYGIEVFADSGGYQLISRPNETIDAIEIFNKQKQVSNNAFILDKPLFKKEGTTMVPLTDEKSFTEHLQYTVQNVRKISTQNKEGIKVYAILHGNSPLQYYRWWQELKEIMPYEGISLKTKTYQQFIMSFFTIMKDDFIRLHALGTSSRMMIVLFYYTLMKYEQSIGKKIELFTFDSTSGLQLAKYKGIHTEMGYYHKGFNIKIENNIKNTYCSCKMCVWLRSESGDESYNIFKNGGMKYLSIHNFNMIHRYNKFVDMLSSDEELLLEWANSRFESYIAKWLYVIDEIFEVMMKHPKKHFYELYEHELRHVKSFIESDMCLYDETHVGNLDDLFVPFEN